MRHGIHLDKEVRSKFKFLEQLFLCHFGRRDSERGLLADSTTATTFNQAAREHVDDEDGCGGRSS